MRLLLLTPFLPDAGAAHGGGAYLHALSCALRRQAEVALVALVDAAEQHRLDADRGGWSWLGTAPNPARPQSLLHRARMLWRWTRRPLVAAKCWQPRLLPVLQRALREFRPDVVLVEMAQMAQYLPWLRSVPTVLTDHEAGCPANTRTGLGRLGDQRDRRLWQRHVARYYPLATQLQALTPDDAAALAKELGRPVLVRPPAVQLPEHIADRAATPPRVLFLGDYRHGPNPQAARRLCREVWPLVHARCREAEFWLAGPNEATIADLAGLPGVKVLGFRADLAQLLASVRVLLAPVWSGAGFRVKTATALAHGLPVVTNELGGRGFGIAEAGIEVHESAEQLARATAHWLEHPAAAASAGQAARAWASSHLSADAIAQWQLASADRLRAATRRDP